MEESRIWKEGKKKSKLNSEKIMEIMEENYVE